MVVIEVGKGEQINTALSTREPIQLKYFGVPINRWLGREATAVINPDESGLGRIGLVKTARSKQSLADRVEIVLETHVHLSASVDEVNGRWSYANNVASATS